MSLVADLKVPYIRLVLDTVAPTVAVTATDRVVPPAPWSVAITASEPIATGSFEVVDLAGGLHSVGFDRLSESDLNLLIPTAGLPAGQAVLTGWITDEAGNRSNISAPVYIDALRPFDAVLTFERAYDVLLDHEPAYEATMDLGPAYDVEMTTDAG